MRIIVQRVKEAEVIVGDQISGKISRGLLIFLGVSKQDKEADADYLVRKVSELRLFEDSRGKMNLSALDTGAEILIVSQFTLYGDCKKGRRPSFDKAAEPQKGEELYHYFISEMRGRHAHVDTGVFGAMMDVSLINDGPVTFMLDSV
ncbi:MAG: D-tyrosyl-tRNA(Tyr) deacylase [Candidatus Omnitrophica bacterium]|nr:D-tyrosyl-tRNA(Tyr) deacylase [Candidatus Omnitrophota bacterium]